MKQQNKIIAVALLFFLLPLIEAGAIASWLSNGRGVSIFPLALLMSSAVIPPTAFIYLSLMAAVWRDSMLLAPMAQSLVGVVALLGVHTLARYTLTNRSLLAEVVHILGGYVAYLVGLNSIAFLVGGLGAATNYVFPSFDEAVVSAVVLVGWIILVRRQGMSSWSLA